MTTHGSNTETTKTQWQVFGIVSGIVFLAALICGSGIFAKKVVSPEMKAVQEAKIQARVQKLLSLEPGSILVTDEGYRVYCGISGGTVKAPHFSPGLTTDIAWFRPPMIAKHLTDTVPVHTNDGAVNPAWVALVKEYLGTLPTPSPTP